MEPVVLLAAPEMQAMQVQSLLRQAAHSTPGDAEDPRRTRVPANKKDFETRLEVQSLLLQSRLLRCSLSGDEQPFLHKARALLWLASQIPEGQGACWLLAQCRLLRRGLSSDQRPVLFQLSLCSSLPCKFPRTGCARWWRFQGRIVRYHLSSDEQAVLLQFLLRSDLPCKFSQDRFAL